MDRSAIGWHLNIGAGRIVYQDLVKINMEVRENTSHAEQNPVDAFYMRGSSGKQLQFYERIFVRWPCAFPQELCDMTGEYGIENVFIHAFGDGRDTDRQVEKVIWRTS